MFIRIKTIKGNDYYYLVENKWAGREMPAESCPVHQDRYSNYLHYMLSTTVIRDWGK